MLMLMLKSGLAIFGILFAAATSEAQPVILFPYFLDNGNSGVYLSYSADGRDFLPMNGGQPIFTPPQWPDSQNLTRDPSIIFRDGLFHMVWTSNWSGRVFGYASSPDLVSWSTPRQVTPFPGSLPSIDQPDNVWAPEILYDQFQGNYQIVFSSTTRREETDGDGSQDDTGNDHRLYSVRTTDFETFTPAAKHFDHNYSVIDGFMYFDDRETAASADDRWIMAIKREQSTANGGKNIRFTFTDPLQSAGWSTATNPFLGPGSPIRSTQVVEGPSMIRWEDEWLLYADAYSSGRYSMISSPDLTNWTDETANLSFPVTHPRHATVFVADRENVGWRFAHRSDLNEDGLIDPADWLVLLENIPSDVSEMGPVERALYGDLNADGAVDYFDFQLFKRDYATAKGTAGVASLPPVPEPAAGMMAAIAAIALGAYLRATTRLK
jgi:hypothetical protein